MKTRTDLLADQLGQPVGVDPALIDVRKRARDRVKPSFNPTVPQYYDYDEHRWVTVLPAVYVAYVQHPKTKAWTLLAFVNLRRAGARLTCRRMDRLRKRWTRSRKTRDYFRFEQHVIIKYVELFTAAQNARDLQLVQQAISSTAF